MVDYVERLDALKELALLDTGEEEYTDNISRTRATIAISNIPAADVAPVVHAHWIPQKENHEFKEALMNCSTCGYPVSRWTGNTNFCPNCGAKMDGGGEHGNK